MVNDSPYSDPDLYRASLYNKLAIGVGSLPGTFLVNFLVNRPEITILYLIKAILATLLAIASRSLFNKSLDIVQNRYKIREEIKK